VPEHSWEQRFQYRASSLLRLRRNAELAADGYPAMSPWLTYTSWIPNLIAVAIYSAVIQRQPTLATA
jgi:hypothetical protein